MYINLKNEYRHTIDAKNRLFIPAKHREMMNGDFVIFASPSDDCLRVYPQEYWREYDETKLSNIKGQLGKMTRRKIYQSAIPGDPDAQGRVVLTELLKNHAHIKKDVVILGVGPYAEIWAAELYDQQLSAITREEIMDIAEEYDL